LLYPASRRVAKGERVKKNRKLFTGAALVAVLATLGVVQGMLDKAAAQAKQVPRFEVDPFWPKPMPNNEVFGQTIGLGISADDHVWIIHRGNDPGNLDRTEISVTKPGAPPVSECCNPAPPVVEFDPAGNRVGAWGGPVAGAPYQWPESNHGIVVDQKGFVWIGGNGGPDSHILKFTRDGKFVAQYGKPGARADATGKPGPNGQPAYRANSKDMDNFGRVAKIFIDPKANEGYLADGYLNHRVAVIDLDNGKIKRMWGAYGEPPTDENLGPYDPAAPLPRQFRNPMHCAMMSNDGLVYTCDRPNDRVQVFTKEGKFVQEYRIEPQTRSDGSVWDIDFSKDAEQRYLYMADGANEHVRIFDRKTMTELYNFGYGGRQPGMFLGVHSIAVDSKGNLYTTETYTGKRLQKFVYKGLGAVPKSNQVPAWPGSGN
jgi:DNA-binding beta-propeller fold protein YncE